MGEIVSLNKFRKAKNVAKSEIKASQNRVRTGLSKQNRDEVKRKNTLAEQSLDAKRLED